VYILLTLLLFFCIISWYYFGGPKNIKWHLRTLTQFYSNAKIIVFPFIILIIRIHNLSIFDLYMVFLIVIKILEHCIEVALNNLIWILWVLWLLLIFSQFVSKVHKVSYSFYSIWIRVGKSIARRIKNALQYIVHGLFNLSISIVTIHKIKK
jgi:hypothetical protein